MNFVPFVIFVVFKNETGEIIGGKENIVC